MFVDVQVCLSLVLSARTNCEKHDLSTLMAAMLCQPFDVVLRLAGMATTADLMTLQKQIRQERTDLLQRVRADMHTAIIGILDATSSISSAMRLSRSCRNIQAVQDQRLDPEELGRQPRQGPVQELHGRGMQAWSDQGERILVRVESANRVGRSTMAVDRTEAGGDTGHGR